METSSRRHYPPCVNTAADGELTNVVLPPSVFHNICYHNNRLLVGLRTPDTQQYVDESPAVVQQRREPELPEREPV